MDILWGNFDKCLMHLIKNMKNEEAKACEQVIDKCLPHNSL